MRFGFRFKLTCHSLASHPLYTLFATGTVATHRIHVNFKSDASRKIQRPRKEMSGRALEREATSPKRKTAGASRRPYREKSLSRDPCIFPDPAPFYCHLPRFVLLFTSRAAPGDSAASLTRHVYGADPLRKHLLRPRAAPYSRNFAALSAVGFFYLDGAGGRRFLSEAPGY